MLNARFTAVHVPGDNTSISDSLCCFQGKKGSRSWLQGRCQRNPLPNSSLEPVVATAMALVWWFMSTTMWEAYEKETLVGSAGADMRDKGSCVLYFVGRVYSEGVSPTGMNRKLSVLAF